MAISLGVFQVGTICRFAFCRVCLPTVLISFGFSVMDLPSLLLPLLPSAGKALKLNSDPHKSYFFFFFFLIALPTETELHSRSRKFWKLSCSDSTGVTWKLCSPSHSEMPILISFRELSWPSPGHLLVSQKYVVASCLQGGIYISRHQLILMDC